MQCELLYSNPTHPLCQILLKRASEVFGAPCGASVRVGGTDGKHTRRYGIPTLSCGVEGGFMGVPDEYVDLSEVKKVFTIHVLSVLAYLQ